MELSEEQMYLAILEKDSNFEGIFYTAVKTTGIFCRPSCTAKKPKKENVEFFKTAKECLAKGYRPCKVCKPLEEIKGTPIEIQNLLRKLTADPSQKFKDYDLVQLGLDPTTLRRWFMKNHGMTFHAYQRLLRINSAFKKIQQGETVTETAFDSGFESLSGFGSSFKSIFGVAPTKSKNIQIVHLKRIETKLGTMIACASEKGICLLEFADRKMLETELKALTKSLNAVIIQGENQHFQELEKQLREYFEGKRKSFDLPLNMVGTDFQKKVWNMLMCIPYGETRSYKAQADAIHQPQSVRAVANANGMNKISIIIPCHRVIGSDGNLTGYGGGIWRKKYLLEMEKCGI